MGGMALPQRYAARVVLLDPQGRVLLMSYDDPPPNGFHWCTPGGGLDPGETYEQAALRELAEETGWTDIELGPEVYQQTRMVEIPQGQFLQHERLFLARTDVSSRPITGVDAMHDSDGIAGWRWWTRDELMTTSDKIWPAELADLIEQDQSDTGAA